MTPSAIWNTLPASKRGSEMGGPGTESAIIDRIYEAAFLPDEWPKALGAISALSGSAAGTIFLFGDDMPVRGRSEEIVRPLFDEFVASDAWKVSDSVQRTYTLRPSEFIVVDDLMSAEEIERDPVRRKLRAFGIGRHICAVVPMPTGELVTFVFQRWLKDGACDPASLALLNSFRPHLARAGLIAARLGLERAHEAVAALEAIGLPAAIMTGAGRVLAANRFLEAMSDIFLSASHGGLAIAHAPANALLQEAITGNRADAVVRSFPVPASQGQRAMVVHVLPLRRTARDLFSGAELLVAATVPSPGAFVPSAGILMGLFDLTPAEARLATNLNAGQSLGVAAAASGITVKSARTYLERIFRKTGTHQQSELVALLKTVHPFPAH
ncbi:MULTISPECIES: helix-turn-helix transcriptional regulator [unclassified Mesorhizobium]|uniref:helix-turn-helix transcriptional regulator n=2 Tax=Mesorhizobium TaxID=68287 RepID=UPI001FDF5849|nr:MULTISPECIES: helix-turn-helix transcriptional regulator [unclassified Mesorhizobium]